LTRYLDRKSFVMSLGVAGLGLVATGVGSGSRALAQDAATPAAGTTAGQTATRETMRQELYTEFTQALASELNITNADEVDAAIRKAIMSVIDAHVSDGMLTQGQAEALKTIVATAEAPIAPGFFGPGGGMFMHGEHGMAEGRGQMGPGCMGPGRGGSRGRGKPGGDWSGGDDDDRESPRMGPGSMMPGSNDTSEGASSPDETEDDNSSS
jgi:hypothetical protein